MTTQISILMISTNGISDIDNDIAAARHACEVGATLDWVMPNTKGFHVVENFPKPDRIIYSKNGLKQIFIGIKPVEFLEFIANSV
jgi:hypothetical protein